MFVARRNQRALSEAVARAARERSEQERESQRLTARRSQPIRARSEPLCVAGSLACSFGVRVGGGLLGPRGAGHLASGAMYEVYITPSRPTRVTPGNARGRPFPRSIGGPRHAQSGRRSRRRLHRSRSVLQPGKHRQAPERRAAAGLQRGAGARCTPTPAGRARSGRSTAARAGIRAPGWWSRTTPSTPATGTAPSPRSATAPSSCTPASAASPPPPLPSATASMSRPCTATGLARPATRCTSPRTTGTAGRGRLRSAPIRSRTRALRTAWPAAPGPAMWWSCPTAGC